MKENRHDKLLLSSYYPADQESAEITDLYDQNGGINDENGACDDSDESF